MWQQLEGSERRLVCQGKCVEAWLPREYPWWKQMECGHRVAARIGAAAATAFVPPIPQVPGRACTLCWGLGHLWLDCGEAHVPNDGPIRLCPSGKGLIPQKEIRMALFRERECGLKGQQAGNIYGAGIAQAPERLLSFSLWYTSLEHLRAKGTLLSGTGLRTSACAELTTMLRDGLVQQASGHKDAEQETEALLPPSVQGLGCRPLKPQSCLPEVFGDHPRLGICG